MTMTFATSLQHVAIVITREGWRFEDDTARVVFGELPVAERLKLRSAFAGQVELAKSTPQ